MVFGKGERIVFDEATCAGCNLKIGFVMFLCSMTVFSGGLYG